MIEVVNFNTQLSKQVIQVSLLAGEMNKLKHPSFIESCLYCRLTPQCLIIQFNCVELCKPVQTCCSGCCNRLNWLEPGVGEREQCIALSLCHES